MSKDTKALHSTTSEDSLLRDLKKENIKLRSLCRRASEEIRDLDDMIIKSIEDNKVIEYPEEDKAYFAGFSSINLLNRLEGRTNGGYVENYPMLLLEMQELDAHPPECKWHKDWHACDCGVFDNIMNKNDTNEQNNEQKCWTVKVEHLDATDPDRGMGELCVRLPDELMEQLGWEIGDEIEWGETEICEDWGEHKGLTLSNLTKNPKEI